MLSYKKLLKNLDSLRTSAIDVIMAQFNVAVSLAKNEQAKFQMLQDTIETVRQAEYSYKTLKANLRKMFKEYNKGVMKKK